MEKVKQDKTLAPLIAGRRKTSVARVRVTSGTGKITINKKDINNSEYLKKYKENYNEYKEIYGNSRAFKKRVIEANDESIDVLIDAFLSSDENIIKGIMEYKKSSGRGEKIEIGPFVVIDDTYNASFESVEQAIISLAKYSSSVGKKSVLIIGDMLEIGDFSREYHTKIGEIARKYALDFAKNEGCGGAA